MERCDSSNPRHAVKYMRTEVEYRRDICCVARDAIIDKYEGK